MNATRAEIINESIRRLEQLVDKMRLNPNVIKYFKQGKVYYSYITGFVIGSIDTITYDPRYEIVVKEFEEEYEGCVVYHAIEFESMLSLLFVGNNKDTWCAEELIGNSIFSYTVNFEENTKEFGSIYVSDYMNSGALIRTLEAPVRLKSKAKPTKKNMVEFIYKYCSFGGEKLTKRELNAQSEETLRKIIALNPDVEDGFEEYLCFLGNDEDATQIDEFDEREATEYFRKVSAALLENENSMLANMHFYNAFNVLPMKKIPIEVLEEMHDRFSRANNNLAALEILKYKIELQN
jgi:hypothetical protein